LTYPSASGTQGGGNAVFESYEIIAYPTVIVITPDHQIVNQFIDPPTTENITDAVIAAGGIWVSTPEEDAVVANISVHPNPVNTNGFLSFNVKESANLQYGIYDMLGKQLYLSEEMFVSGGQTKLPLPVIGLENGMYFVRLLINEKLPQTIRFIVAK
jgi:hypothetical protein